MGLVSDSITGIPFGTSSLAYMTIYKIAVYQETIRLRTVFLSEWAALGMALLIAYSIVLVTIYLSGASFNIFIHIYNFIGSLILYPFIWFILKSLLSKYNLTKNNNE